MPDVRLTVVDDRSTDPATVAVLRSMPSDVRVLDAMHAGTPAPSEAAVNGGLHANMQWFLDAHASCTVVLFMQDDMQLVRAVSATDLAEIGSIYEAFPRTAFIYPGFLASRLGALDRVVDRNTLLPGAPSCSFAAQYEFGGFFDVCLAHVPRLRAIHWCFGNELESSRTALRLFGPMRLLRRPFTAHLPAPPTYRHRNRTLVQWFWEWRHTGLFPIDPLSPDAMARLHAAGADLPTAEALLTSSTFGRSHPWPYVKLEGAPATVLWMDRIEAGLRRRLARAGQALGTQFRAAP